MDMTHCLFHWGKFCHHRLLEVAHVVMSGRAQQKSHIEASLCRWDEIRKDNHPLGLPHLKITEMSSWIVALCWIIFYFPQKEKASRRLKCTRFALFWFCPMILNLWILDHHKTKKPLTLFESSFPGIKKISLKEKFVFIAPDVQL